MSKALQRTLGVVMAALLLIGALAGCTQTQTPTTAPTTAPTAAPTAAPTEAATEAATASPSEPPTAASLDPVTLRFYIPGTKPAAFDEVWAAIADATKAKLNATFEVNFVGFNDYLNKIQMLLSSGDKYDMDFDAAWYGFPATINKGGYMDIKDLLPKYAPEYYKKLQDLGVIPSITIGGKIYGTPWTLYTNDHPFVSIDTKKALGDKAGDLLSQFPINSVKTCEDLDKLLALCKQLEPSKHIFEWDGLFTYSKIVNVLCPKYNYIDTDHGFYGFVYKLDDPTCKLVPVEQTEMYKEAAQWVKKWVDEGYIPKDLMLNRDSHGTEDPSMKVVGFNTNEYLNFVSGTSNPDWYSELYPEGNFVKRSPLDNLYCINVNAANPERTLMFLNLAYTQQDLYNMIIYGIENKTYVKKDGAFVYPDGMDQSTSNYMDWTGQWGFWSGDLMQPSSSRTAQGWANMKEFVAQPNSVMIPLSGFFPSTDPIKNEIAKRSSLETEQGKPIMYGLVADVGKSITDYVAAQKAAGTDAIQAELQKQVDAFLAAKK